MIRRARGVWPGVGTCRGPNVLAVGSVLGLLLVVSTPGPSLAQDTTAVRDTLPEVSPEHWPHVTGQLTDRATGEPIVGATLRFADLDASAVSDSAGRFVLPQVPPGSHELRIRHVAYGTREVEVTVRADVTTRLQLRLDPQAVEVEPIEVSVEFRPEYLEDVGFYERMERGWGNYVDPEYADQLYDPMPYFRGVHDLLKVTKFAMPQTVIERVRSCGGWTTYVNRRPNEYFGILGQLRGEEVGAVEVYPHGHGVPAWAMSFGGCGVILVWTERW